MPSINTLLPLALLLLGITNAHPLEPRAAFTLQNGKDAAALNAKFATLTKDSPCESGTNACIGDEFAQCAGGKFVSFPCAGGLVCRALPLVNSPGTSITCDTAVDAQTRIQNTGAARKRQDRIDMQRRAEFTLKNGQDAIALNKQFATLTAGSSCSAGPNACIGDQFAQCVGDKYVTVGCAGGLVCRALPLVNSPGTSITCDTAADAETRIAATGATGGAAPAAAAPPTAAPAAAPAPAAAAPAPAVNAAATGGAAVAPAACANKKRSLGLFARGSNLNKRIAQADLPAVAQSWHDLCVVSGGDLTGDPCSKFGGINGINALLAAEDPCAQQDNADGMIDFAKSAGIKNKDALIKNAQAFAVHPRNALDIGGGLIPSTPFCQRAPKNAELNGLSHKQLDGVNPGLFGGPKFAVVPFGDPASCPLGKKPDVATCTCV